jgi:hypothetical protein
MSRAIASLVALALISVPAFADVIKVNNGGQLTWSDDFQRTGGPEVSDAVVQYDYCVNGIGSRPQYTAFEPISASEEDCGINCSSAEIENGQFILSNKTRNLMGFTDNGNIGVAVLGWKNFVGNCTGGSPLNEFDTQFDDTDICIYGGYQFSRWNLAHTGISSGGGVPGDANGPDGGPGYAGVDDDGDGTTDFNGPAAIGINNGRNELFGYNLKYNNGNAGFVSPHGPDGAPGVAGVDDDANGVTDDDLNERGFGDDADDDQGTTNSGVFLRTQIGVGYAISLAFDGFFTTKQIFIRETNFFVSNDPDDTDELGPNFYQAGVQYNFAFCASGSCYGAELWVGDDAGNPVETLGPVVIPPNGNAGNEVGFSGTTYSSGARTIREGFTFTPNTSYGNKFWVVEGGTLASVPASVPMDRDADGDVDGVDFSVFASCFNKAGNPPRTIGCSPDDQINMDSDGDGDIDGVDFSVFASCFNKAGNPPRTLGCNIWDIPALPVCP